MHLNSLVTVHCALYAQLRLTFGSLLLGWLLWKHRALSLVPKHVSCSLERSQALFRLLLYVVLQLGMQLLVVFLSLLKSLEQNFERDRSNILDLELFRVHGGFWKFFEHRVLPAQGVDWPVFERAALKEVVKLLLVPDVAHEVHRLARVALL